MKKRILIVTSLLMVCFIAFVILENPFSKENNKVENISKAASTENRVNFEGKTDSFNSLKELEDGSSIIVRGTKVGKLKTKIYKSKIDGSVNGGYTESDFKIIEVYKNSENNKKIEANKKISVVELNFRDDTKTTYTVNGYENMVDGKEYLLFLTEQDGLFATRGVNFGKIPLSTNELEVSNDENDINNTEILKTIFSDARAKYGN